MIKLIIFDLSDVCFTAEEPSFLEAFSKEHNIDQKELEDAYIPEVKKAEVGEQTAAGAWDIVAKRFNLAINSAEIVKEVMKDKQPIQEVLDLVKELRKKCKTAYLTNYTKDYWDVFSFPMDDYFDFGIASFQIKARKPDVKGFLTIMEHFNVAPQETIFIDNSKKNLVNAEEIGINTIHFTTKDKLIEDLKEYGL